MIIIRVLLVVSPASLEAFREHAADEGKSASALPGCVHYRFFEAVGEPGTVLLYEEWETLEAFEAYKASSAFKANAEKLFPMLAGKPDSAYFDGQPFGS